MEKIKDNTKEIASIPAITQELTSTRKKLKKGEYIEAVGRRKTAVARVRITPNDKSVFVVNGKPLGNYFTTDTLQTVVKNPIQQVNLDEKFSTSVIVKGGGMQAQAEATRHGISRALVDFDTELRKNLKKAGFLKRDPRKKERKKFGLKKARRAPQWSKR
ncbi:30S ribosomal protein S9 [Patescibacteria group bacterium]|nr:30S ribosomal protein S9 [Patescibacteria group bacterium]MBU2460555.1 30S ribosomal protein S9 [Patescibacteria group bacterium]